MSNCATLMLFIMVVCVFIANAKTTQAPDSTLRCLLLKWKVLKQGSERRIGLTDFTDWLTDSCSFWSIQQRHPCATTHHTSTAWTDLKLQLVRSLSRRRTAPLLELSNHKLGCGYKPLPPGLETIQSHFGCVFIIGRSQPGYLDCSIAVENELG